MRAAERRELGPSAGSGKQTGRLSNPVLRWLSDAEIDELIHQYGNIATLDVEEALLHCAKAIMRSELWTPRGTTQPNDGTAIAAFLADTPFVVLVSTDADGHADASPKGDPAGLIRQIDDTTIAIADRPGNRRTDTLHKRVRNRTPKVALVIDVEDRELRDEPALSAADLWNPSRHIDDRALPPAATIWADHVRRNTDAGTGAKLARRLVNKTALAAGVAFDYKTNL